MSSIVLISYFVLVLFTLAVNAAWIFTENNFLVDILDLMQIVVLALLPVTPALSVFIIGISFANSVLRHSNIAGAVLYAATYIIDFALLFKPDADSMVVAGLMAVFVTAVAVYGLKAQLAKPFVVVLAWLYGTLVLGSLAYLGRLTGNIGFALLVAGDLLLAVYFVKSSKAIYCISNSFFYLGVYTAAFAFV